VIKINAKGKKQARVLVVTDQAMYNLDEKYKCKRRIVVSQLAGLTESKSSDQFVVHVPSEYDYHYSSANASQIRDALRAAFQAQTKDNGKAFPVVVTEEADLAINVVTQGIAKRMEEGKKNAPKFVDYAAGDYLKLADHPLILEMLHTEKLLLSLKTIKINRKLKNQERVLLVTDKAVYNLNPQLINKRRVPLDRIVALTMSKKSEQFVVHVPMEYDYHFSSTKNTEIAKVLQRAADKAGSGPLILTSVDEADLSQHVLTQELADLQSDAEKQARREALRTRADESTSKRGSSTGPSKSPKPAAKNWQADVHNDTNFEVDDDGDG